MTCSTELPHLLMLPPVFVANPRPQALNGATGTAGLPRTAPKQVQSRPVGRHFPPPHNSSGKALQTLLGPERTAGTAFGQAQTVCADGLRGQVQGSEGNEAAEHVELTIIYNNYIYILCLSILIVSSTCSTDLTAEGTDPVRHKNEFMKDAGPFHAKGSDPPTLNHPN